MRVSDLIIPVSNVDTVAARVHCTLQTVTTSGSGNLIVFQVSSGHRFWLYCMQNFKSTGTFTWTETRLQMDGQPVLWEQFAATDYKVTQFPAPIPLEYGGAVQVSIDSESVPGNLTTRAYYYDEVIGDIPIG